jgi:hypothetical protein
VQSYNTPDEKVTRVWRAEISLFCYVLFMTRTSDEDSGVPITATTTGVQMLKRQVQRLLWPSGGGGSLGVYRSTRSDQLCVFACV